MDTPLGAKTSRNWGSHRGFTPPTWSTECSTKIQRTQCWSGRRRAKPDVLPHDQSDAQYVVDTVRSSAEPSRCDRERFEKVSQPVRSGAVGQSFEEGLIIFRTYIC